MNQALKRSLILYDLAREMIYQIGGSNEGFIPKLQGHGSIRKQGETDFYYVTMLSFGRSILLMCIRT